MKKHGISTKRGTGLEKKLENPLNRVPSSQHMHQVDYSPQKTHLDPLDPSRHMTKLNHSPKNTPFLYHSPKNSTILKSRKKSRNAPNAPNQFSISNLSSISSSNLENAFVEKIPIVFFYNGHERLPFVSDLPNDKLLEHFENKYTNISKDVNIDNFIPNNNETIIPRRAWAAKQEVTLPPHAQSTNHSRLCFPNRSNQGDRQQDRCDECLKHYIQVVYDLLVFVFQYTNTFNAEFLIQLNIEEDNCEKNNSQSLGSPNRPPNSYKDLINFTPTSVNSINDFCAFVHLFYLLKSLEKGQHSRMYRRHPMTKLTSQDSIEEGVASPFLVYSLIIYKKIAYSQEEYQLWNQIHMVHVNSFSYNSNSNQRMSSLNYSSVIENLPSLYQQSHPPLFICNEGTDAQKYFSTRIPQDANDLSKLKQHFYFNHIKEIQSLNLKLQDLIPLMKNFTSWDLISNLDGNEQKAFFPILYNNDRRDSFDGKMSIYLGSRAQSKSTSRIIEVRNLLIYFNELHDRNQTVSDYSKSSEVEILCLNDTSIRSHHSRIEIVGDIKPVCYISPLKDGKTMVNGEQIYERIQLKEGMIISFGDMQQYIYTYLEQPIEKQFIIARYHSFVKNFLPIEELNSIDPYSNGEKIANNSVAEHTHLSPTRLPHPANENTSFEFNTFFFHGEDIPYYKYLEKLANTIQSDYHFTSEATVSDHSKYNVDIIFCRSNKNDTNDKMYWNMDQMRTYINNIKGAITENTLLHWKKGELDEIYQTALEGYRFVTELLSIFQKRFQYSRESSDLEKRDAHEQYQKLLHVSQHHRDSIPLGKYTLWDTLHETLSHQYSHILSLLEQQRDMNNIVENISMERVQVGMENVDTYNDQLKEILRKETVESHLKLLIQQKSVADKRSLELSVRLKEMSTLLLRAKERFSRKSSQMSDMELQFLSMLVEETRKLNDNLSQEMILKEQYVKIQTIENDTSNNYFQKSKLYLKQDLKYDNSQLANTSDILTLNGNVINCSKKDFKVSQVSSKDIESERKVPIQSINGNENFMEGLLDHRSEELDLEKRPRRKPSLSIEVVGLKYNSMESTIPSENQSDLVLLDPINQQDNAPMSPGITFSPTIKMNNNTRIQIQGEVTPFARASSLSDDLSFNSSDNLSSIPSTGNILSTNLFRQEKVIKSKVVSNQSSVPAITLSNRMSHQNATKVQQMFANPHNFVKYLSSRADLVSSKGLKRKHIFKQVPLNYSNSDLNNSIFVVFEDPSNTLTNRIRNKIFKVENI